MIEVIHAARRVTDLDAALAFYVDGLGLERRRGFVEDPDGHLIELIERLEGPPPDGTADEDDGDGDGGAGGTRDR